MHSWDENQMESDDRKYTANEITVNTVTLDNSAIGLTQLSKRNKASTESQNRVKRIEELVSKKCFLATYKGATTMLFEGTFEK